MDRNDLISRSELKKAIETCDKFACLPDTKLMPFHKLNEPEKNYEPYVHLRDIKNAIDNTPTVKTYCYFCGQAEHGVEEKPQGDLISREALKRSFAEYGEKAKFTQGFCQQLIDNATTVDLWQMRQEATENALKKAEVLYARPQGEKIKKEHYGWVYCSECDSLLGQQDNFCWNCGADVRQPDEPDKQITIEEYMQSLKGEKNERRR